MKIIFKKRPIHRAPIAVLQHLYYYTAQYGLSVRQFTGAHWTYWEKLPEHLRNAQNNPEELKSIIEELKKLVTLEMESAAQLKVPLKVDLGVGHNWVEAH